MVSLINAQRAASGLPALIEVRGLDSAAYDADAWLAANNQFCHECPGEPSIGARTGKYGYGWSGEILVGGCTTPECTVDAWMGSPGHRAVILSAAVTIGCDLFIVAQPLPGQFPGYATCDFSGDQPHGDAVGAGPPAPTATPTSRLFLPTATRTFTPVPTWTPYQVWPPTATATRPPSGGPSATLTPRPSATPPPSGGAWYLTIEISPWAGTALQQQASSWLCGRYGVTCRWELR